MKKVFKYLSNKLELQIMIFIILLPFIDIYDFFIGSSIEILGISMIEIFKILVANYLLIFTIISKKDKLTFLWQKYKKFIYVGLFLFAIYIVVHVINVGSFNFYIFNKNTDNNILVELYYIYRTYFVSLILLFVIMMSDISKKRIIKLISAICFLVSTIIVLSNIFKVGYVAYSSYLEEDTIIHGSIFSWFSDLNIYNADFYTTKGFFFSVNQLSIVLFISFMISILNFVNYNEKYLYFTTFIKSLALLMLSTKVCGIGLFLILMLYICLIIFFKILNKQKFQIFKFCYLIFLFLFFLVLFFYSPLRYKIQLFNNNFIKNSDTEKEMFAFSKIENNDTEKEIFIIPKTEENDVTESTDNTFYEIKQDEYDKANSMSLIELANIEELNEYEKSAFINKLTEERGNLGIHLSYIELYQIEDNVSFWQKVVLLPQSNRINFRKFKLYLYNDVLQKNNNIFMDKMFGIGYISDFPYLEMDFLGQDVWFGKVGTICFVWIYVVVYLIISVKFLFNMRKSFNLENCILCICIGSTFLISYIAGHMFGNIFPITILTLVLKAYSCIGNEVK